MERLGTCGVCEFYSSKVDYTDSSEGRCYVDGVGLNKWTSSRNTCSRHVEHRDIAILELRRGLEEVRARLKGWRQRIADCEKRIREDRVLISEVEPREKELLAELKKRGEDDPERSDDD